MNKEKLKGIGAFLMAGPLHAEKGGEEHPEEEQEDSMDEVALDAMKAFISSVKAGNAEESLVHFKHLSAVCSSPMEDGEHEY